MASDERVILTNMCMIRNGTKVLVEDKITKDTRGIMFPGGHVEKDEPIVDSVIREMKEETGLTIEDPVLCGIKNWIEEDGTRYIVFLFRTDKFSGELTSSPEGQVFWAEIGDVLKLPYIWEMDSLMRIFINSEFTELFQTARDEWKPVLK